VKQLAEFEKVRHSNKEYEKMKILIVDDNKHNLYILESWLKNNNYETVPAKNGAEALEKLCFEEVDMVISDILMPVMDGYKLCQKVKSDDKLKSIPFIFYTGTYIDKEDEKLAKKCGVDKFIRKPIDEDKFIQIIKETIGDVEEDKLKSRNFFLEDKSVLELYNARLAKKLEKKILSLEKEIKQRKKTEQELQKSEERYRLLAETAGDIILVHDIKGKVVYVNEAGVKISGYSREEIKNMNIDVLICPEYLEEAKKRYSKRLSGDSNIYRYESEIFNKQREQIFLEISSSPVVQNDKIKEIIVIARDVTRRKKAEREIHKLNQFMQTIVDNANVWLTVLDKDRNVVIWNKAAEEISGYTCEEIVGHGNIWEKLYPDEEYRNEVKEKAASIINGETVENFRTTICRKDSQTRTISWNARSFLDNEDQSGGLIVIGRDITEHLKMEKELQKIDKLKSVGVLAAGIAHDFNNLLTAILGNIQLAKMYSSDDYPKSAIERLTEAEKASMQAKDLTQRLLTFSKGGEPVKQTAQISEIIKATVQLALSGSNVGYEFSIHEELWLAEVDTGQISQVIQNLVANANQAMPTGGVIKIKAENYVSSNEDNIPIKDGKYIKISFSDEGAGIAEKFLSKIFDPYFTTKSKDFNKGTGLGLSICHSIIEKHGGYITVESKLGVGTTFYVYLPACQKEVEEKVEVEERNVFGRGKVLLMDDEEMVRKVAGEILRHLGYDVEFAKNGSSAIKLYKQALQSKPFDAVILDLTIPGGIGGKETLEQLQEIDPKVKAIVSSGYSTDSIISNYKQYGFSGAIVKPYNIKELSDILRKITL